MCASCHYQGYASGSKIIRTLIEAFLDHMLPVPPEITGHPQYGVNKSQSLITMNIPNWQALTIPSAGNAMGKSLLTALPAQFMHNVSASVSGGRNCTACHGRAAVLRNAC